MRSSQEYAYKNYLTGAIITAVLGTLLVTISFILTKNTFFLLLNADMGRAADYFFSYWTHLGDGTVWVPVGILFLVYRRDKFVLALSTVAIGTLIVQSLKNFIIPAQIRPGTAILDLTTFHSVASVPMLTNYSFPSGHTTTAFSVFLLGCLMIKKKWIVPVGLLYALLVGYSRIYLAEHFPLDVGGGMLTALVSVWLSVYVQSAWDKSRSKRIR
ncbi:MAG: phosphatase PAP2 family protein [Chitinophagaceae bacterium]|nr:phosphatase PAP2 family protein [Chitinophagaceae bacterium]